eukprot:TRINITY_DN24331_c0_g1_i2.p1 TRINITY_DN24331_c0_g1~~TRINITY_DN24331_c0_g1_i2.p1  ORF type:complete len:239 (-),score=57.97 TRINITY_DN24331_c0_g1_i2:65-781(-)
MSARRCPGRTSRFLRATALLSGFVVAIRLSTSLVFVSISPKSTSKDVATSSRRNLLSTVLGGALLQSSAAWAEEEAPKKKKERPPDNLLVTGVPGTPSELKNANGRWTIVLGKKISGQPVYQRDGQSLYLLTNECEEFQISTAKPKDAACNGIATKKKGASWTVNGKEVPDLKVIPAKPGDKLPEEKKEDIKEIIAREVALVEKEDATKTFRGTLSDDEEDAGDRLMSKMGAKIIKGM